MTKPTIDKLVENEAMFRKKNEAVQEDIKLLNDISDAQGDDEVISKDMILEFYCECSDEDCMLRIPMSIDQYEDIHKDRKQFIVKPDHDVASVEEVIEHRSGYSIVKKAVQVPEYPDGFNKTALSNV